MDAKLVSPFLEAVFQVLPAVGCEGAKRGELKLKNKLSATMDVTALIGLSGSLRGNVIYCMAEETARNMASIMMMGMPVEQLDEMSRSALAELSNMITAAASTIFSGRGINLDISPSTLITGKNVKVMVSQVQTLSVQVIAPPGIIELNVGLEV